MLFNASFEGFEIIGWGNTWAEKRAAEARVGKLGGVQAVCLDGFRVYRFTSAVGMSLNKSVTSFYCDPCFAAHSQNHPSIYFLNQLLHRQK